MHWVTTWRVEIGSQLLTPRIIHPLCVFVQSGCCTNNTRKMRGYCTLLLGVHRGTIWGMVEKGHLFLGCPLSMSDHTGRGDTMPVRYKVDVLAALKNAGYTSYRIRQEKLIGERALQKIREGELVSWAVIGSICQMLHCQPGDLVEYVEDSDKE